ncbi:unnamed protein product [Rhizophagus irregularis]|nr:unnamed protein product [Rhizophagus irregularis]
MNNAKFEKQKDCGSSFIDCITIFTLENLGVIRYFESETSFAQSNFTELIECSAFATCGECTSHLACGFCVTTNKCVQGGWKGPFKDPEICTIDNWEYEYAQCFDTIFDFQKIRNPDDERAPLVPGDTIATQHFRRASFYNYNRNRPFERRGRTLSSGTVNSAMQYGRNWRNGSDEYMYGYGALNTPSLLWVNENPGVPTDYAMGSHNNSLGNGEWRKWEKKREELLAKYAKNPNES